MALTPEDVQAIGELLDRKLDQKMASHSEAVAQQLRDQERRRRRFWSWVIWITILLTLGSLLASYWWVKDQVAAFTAATSEIRSALAQANADSAAVRAEFAHDKQLQKQRAEVAAASHYKNDQSQAQFDAAMLGKTFALLTQSSKARNRAEAKAKNGEAPDADDAEATKDLTDTLTQSLGLLTQIMLHETDPARQGSAERMAQGEHPEATPIHPSTDQDKAAPAPQPAHPTTSAAPPAQGGGSAVR